ncbi:hypothetical protein QYM36_006729 [Artemia franciscana]|uniref:Uncharacterized protein n=1 Tax=Artemia franciscana TaxID=6661 RepID=A0AA88I4F9_ARTSF|nr:hypothetical protein QYM36_006729 [Artemia franciscana]
MDRMPEQLREKFFLGHFTMKRSFGSANAVSPDHALESSLNFEAKQKGSIKGMILNTTAIAKWPSTFPFCAKRATYDGLYFVKDPEGCPFLLKDSSGYHGRKSKGNRRTCLISLDTTLENWEVMLTQSSSKAKIAEIIFGAWKEETENTPFPLVLAEGFRERREVHVRVLPPNVCSLLAERLAFTHEEADTRVVLHVTECYRRGFPRVIVKAIDTDILAILIQHFRVITSRFNASNPELYLKFRDKNLPVH